MKIPKIPTLVLGALCLTFIGFLVWSTPRLPDQVATHFGTQGLPDSWMARSSAVMMMGGLGLGLPLLMACLSLAIRFLPSTRLNIPHREYWLAPERRESTYAVVSRRMIWLACLMVCFMAALHAITIEANNATPVRLPMGLFWMLLGGFMLSISLWIGALVWQFKLPRGQVT